MKFRKNGKQSIEPNLTSPFTAQAFSNGIAALKNDKAIGLDGTFTEELTHFGQQAKKWLLELFNRCMETNRIPKIWRKSRVIALPKPGKDLSLPKSFRLISLLCHPYKLFERLLFGRLTPVVEPKIIPQQAGFRRGKSTTGQLLNLTHHIEDGFEKRLVTGAVFVDLSVAYDTVNHRIFMTKIYQMTDDKAMTTLHGTLLKSRMCYVALNQKKSCWRQQRNGLPQGSVLAPLLYNIYTNDQPTEERTSRFIYADDLCITSQESFFEAVERNLTDSLTLLTEYYAKNHLKPNASKTQVSAFHLRNRETNQPLRVTWSGTSLENHPNPLYLGVKLNCTLIYRSHILSTKAKVNTRNNILRKLTNSKWGCTPHTLRTSTLALCYTAAEYACPAWSRSVHASKLDPALNNACRTITGCLKPTNTSNLHLPAGIAPPEIRRETASRAERLRQSTDPRHPLFGSEPAPTRLKSRKSLLRDVLSFVQSKAETNMERSIDKLKSNPLSVDMGIQPSESLPPGGDASWPIWKTLNRLRSGVGRTKANLIKW